MKCYSYITNNSKMIGLKELIFMLPRLWRLYPLWLERIGLELRHSLTSTCSLQRLEMYLITGIIDFERAYHRIIKPSPPVFPTVQGPDRARRTDCQDPWTGRDGVKCPVPVRKI